MGRFSRFHFPFPGHRDIIRPAQNGQSRVKSSHEPDAVKIHNPTDHPSMNSALSTSDRTNRMTCSVSDLNPNSVCHIMKPDYSQVDENVPSKQTKLCDDTIIGDGRVPWRPQNWAENGLSAENGRGGMVYPKGCQPTINLMPSIKGLPRPRHQTGETCKDFPIPEEYQSRPQIFPSSLKAASNHSIGGLMSNPERRKRPKSHSPELRNLSDVSMLSFSSSDDGDIATMPHLRDSLALSVDEDILLGEAKALEINYRGTSMLQSTNLRNLSRLHSKGPTRTTGSGITASKLPKEDNISLTASQTRVKKSRFSRNSNSFHHNECHSQDQNRGHEACPRRPSCKNLRVRSPTNHKYEGFKPSEQSRLMMVTEEEEALLDMIRRKRQSMAYGSFNHDYNMALMNKKRASFRENDVSESSPRISCFLSPESLASHSFSTKRDSIKGNAISSNDERSPKLFSPTSDRLPDVQKTIKVKIENTSISCGALKTNDNSKPVKIYQSKQPHLDSCQDRGSCYLSNTPCLTPVDLDNVPATLNVSSSPTSQESIYSSPATPRVQVGESIDVAVKRESSEGSEWDGMINVLRDRGKIGKEQLSCIEEPVSDVMLVEEFKRGVVKSKTPIRETKSTSKMKSIPGNRRVSRNMMSGPGARGSVTDDVLAAWGNLGGDLVGF